MAGRKYTNEADNRCANVYQLMNVSTIKPTKNAYERNKRKRAFQRITDGSKTFRLF